MKVRAFTQLISGAFPVAFAFGPMLLAGVGCVNIQRVGPLADPPPPGSAKAKAAVPEPVVRDAPKPTPPALYITPGEVTAENAAEAAKRLTQEIETDRRSLDAMPRYSEVSNPK